MGINNGNLCLVFESYAIKQKSHAHAHLVDKYTRLSAIPMYYILEIKLKISEKSFINFYKWPRFIEINV